MPKKSPQSRRGELSFVQDDPRPEGWALDGWMGWASMRQRRTAVGALGLTPRPTAGLFGLGGKIPGLAAAVPRELGPA